jgi:hypothetical protein
VEETYSMQVVQLLIDQLFQSQSQLHSWNKIKRTDQNIVVRQVFRIHGTWTKGRSKLLQSRWRPTTQLIPK